MWGFRIPLQAISAFFPIFLCVLCRLVRVIPLPDFTDIYQITLVLFSFIYSIFASAPPTIFSISYFRFPESCPFFHTIFSILFGEPGRLGVSSSAISFSPRLNLYFLVFVEFHWFCSVFCLFLFLSPVSDLMIFLHFIFKM